MEKPRFIEQYQHRKRIRAFDREYAERRRPLTIDERTETTRKVLRFVEDNEDSLSEVEATADQDHRAHGVHRRQSAFAATQFVFGETGYFPEQAAPIISQMLEQGVIDRSDTFTELRLTELGRRLVEDYETAVADPAIRDQLPWLDEGWKG